MNQNKIILYSTLQILFSGFTLLYCWGQDHKSSPSGPPFHDLMPGTDTISDGRYFFNPPVTHYRKIQLGELFIKNTHKSPNARFFLTIAGIDTDSNYRVRSYEGVTHRIKNNLQLRAEKCYIFGKKFIDERIVPLERWDCDHLIFEFKIEGNKLRGIQTAVTKFSDWSGPFDLYSAPENALFAAQILENKGDGNFTAYGKEAVRKLNSDHPMKLLKGGAPLKVLKRYDDFFLLKTENAQTSVKPGDIVYTNTPKKTKGLFDE